MRTITTLLFVLLTLTLCAETLAWQNFENSSSDTWNYTAEPAGMTRLVWWGCSDQPMGGAGAQNGSWFWGSWDLDNTEHSLTFDSITLPAGYTHSLSFWYYTNGLNPTVDFSKFCVEYDAGSQWTNWVTLNPDTDAWTQVFLDVPPYATTLRLKLATSYDGFAKYAHWDNIAVTNIPTPPIAPLVYNVSAAQRIDGSKMVDIYYDLFDANLDLCGVDLLLSGDNGATFAAFPNSENLSGDMGDSIANGTGKHIIWDAGADGIDYDTDQYRVRILADDGVIPIPGDFVFVPGGTFRMGDTRGSGYSDELPVHYVTLSPFLIGTYEVTQAEYEAIMGFNPAQSYGIGENYPVYYVSWYYAIKYCNLRSIAEGLTPCYTILGSTNPEDWGIVPTFDSAVWNAAVCNWGANGFRLPTEAEWELAARSAENIPDYLYSGSDVIDMVAWYEGNNTPWSTKPVGSKSSNNIGVYDMSGNVFEWCWDFYGANYYSYSTNSNNPTGPNTGNLRLSRGGCWYEPAWWCRVAARNPKEPQASGYVGIRLCRSLVQ